MRSILLIDECEDYREVTASLLSDAGYDVWEADCPKEAFKILKQEAFDLIVCDLHLPVSTGEDTDAYLTSCEVGVKTIQELKDIFSNIPIIAMSNTPSANLKKISKFLDPIPAYTKPLDSEDIIEIIDSHICAIGGYGLIQ